MRLLFEGNEVLSAIRDGMPLAGPAQRAMNRFAEVLSAISGEMDTDTAAGSAEFTLEASGSQLEPRNGFTVIESDKGLQVTFDAVAPNVGGSGEDAGTYGPQGHIPTPTDLVSVINAMAQASDQGRLITDVVAYLVGHNNEGLMATYAGQAFMRGAIETRMGRVEMGLSEATSAVVEMARNQRAMAQTNVDNLTSISQRLQAIEQTLAMRGAESGTTKMMVPPAEGATAPPPSYEQVAAAERGQPQGAGTPISEEAASEHRYADLTGQSADDIPDDKRHTR
jgi:hypothetical protein